MITEAIILAGGLGTRLKDVITDIPKPMAPVGDMPFLYYILKNLKNQGFRKAILSVGYKYEAIESYFGHQFNSLQLEYAIENEPLGTGGGIANALKFAKGDAIALVNGDTFFDVSISQLFSFYIQHDADIAFSLKEMHQFDRYGRVELDQNNRIKAFLEKEFCKKGMINGGVYILKTSVFDKYNFPLKFSFEKDLLEKYVDELKLSGLIFDKYFIDIGIPSDYERAKHEMPSYT